MGIVTFLQRGFYPVESIQEIDLYGVQTLRSFN